MNLIKRVSIVTIAISLIFGTIFSSMHNAKAETINNSTIIQLSDMKFSVPYNENDIIIIKNITNTLEETVDIYDKKTNAKISR